MDLGSIGVTSERTSSQCCSIDTRITTEWPHSKLKGWWLTQYNSHFDLANFHPIISHQQSRLHHQVFKIFRFPTHRFCLSRPSGDWWSYPAIRGPHVGGGLILSSRCPYVVAWPFLLPSLVDLNRIVMDTLPEAIMVQWKMTVTHKQDLFFQFALFPFVSTLTSILDWKWQEPIDIYRLMTKVVKNYSNHFQSLYTVYRIRNYPPTDDDMHTYMSQIHTLYMNMYIYLYVVQWRCNNIHTESGSDALHTYTSGSFSELRGSQDFNHLSQAAMIELAGIRCQRGLDWKRWEVEFGIPNMSHSRTSWQMVDGP